MSVYRFLNYDVVAPYLVDSQENWQVSGTGQAGSRQQIGTNQLPAGHSRKRENKKERKE